LKGTINECDYFLSTFLDACISMKSLSISNERIQLTFRPNPLSFIEIRNKLTGAIVCPVGSQTFLVRTPLELFEPTILTELQSVSVRPGRIRFVVTDRTRAWRAAVDIDASEDGIRFRMKVSAPKPIWLVEWRLGGLQIDEVIIPALGGQALTKRMPIDTTLNYKYPFWWNAQFVIGSMKAGGCWIHTRDAHPGFKLLRVRREERGFALTYGFEADGPITSKALEAEWYLDCYAGSWRRPVDEHRRWMEEGFRPLPLGENRSFPAWARKINFVLEMWGITKDRPEPLHTFDTMLERLRQWRTLHAPEETLVYVPGFAEHGIDSHAPDYHPSRELGGAVGFKMLVDNAHRMGFRVMVHTNVLAMTFAHRLYPKFKKHQVVDVFGRKQGWGLDMDGDWLAEPYFAYINPGARAWGKLMTKVIGNLVGRFHVDGVFLDQTLLAFNVSRGPNFLLGMRTHIERLQRSFPHILFAGEGLHEQVLSALPFAQIHGIDSLTEVHGMEGNVRWRTAHPVSTYLFGPYTRFVAHLLTKHPSSPIFELQEEAYAKLGVIPALCLYSHHQKLDMPAVQRMIRRARSLDLGITNTAD